MLKRFTLSVLCLIIATPTHAQSVDLSGLAMYGINRENGQMLRYNFDLDRLESMTTVRNVSGKALKGIEASAYIPGNLNIFGFWNDPSDGLTKMVYINTETGLATQVGQDLGSDLITGAVATKTGDPAKWSVYAIQKVEAEEDTTVDFNVVNDTVIPTEDYALKISILGAAIRGSYDIPVTSKIKVGGTDHAPFGSFDNAVSGNLNDNKNPREHIFPSKFPAGTSIDVIARSWLKKRSWYSGSKSSHWKTYLTVDGSSDSKQVKVLRSGDAAPDIEGFKNQQSAEEFVKDYIDPATKKMVMDENQAIYLFELGTTNVTSSAADFQDLVVLVTLANDIDDLDGNDDDDGDSGEASRLIRVDFISGGYEAVMTMDRTYDSLAATPGSNGNVFYGTSGSEIYTINAANQTETRIGTLASDMAALEHAAGALMGIYGSSGSVQSINNSSGGEFGPAINVGMGKVGTIVFTPIEEEPGPAFVLYD